ncbi:MAG: type II toxin-antitoxin system PemK/MazF family toxin [Candidatus Acidiferrales bacterium]
MPKRGDVYLARLDPREGSEQAGQRPVIVVSRDAINQNSPVVIVVPVTDLKHKRRIYPSQVVLKTGDGGLTKDSVALAEQVRAISTSRLVKPMGHLSPASITQIGDALKIALDL